jgi:hypothetical protein
MKEENDSEMVITNLKSIIQNAEALLGLVQNGSAMPEWAEAKVTLAQDYIMSAKDFISAEMMESSDSFSAAMDRAEVKRQNALKKAAEMVKNGFSHEDAAKNHDVGVTELKRYMNEELEQVGEVYKGMKTTSQLRQAITQDREADVSHYGFHPSFSDEQNKKAIDAAKRALGPKGGKVTGIPDSHKHLYKEELEQVDESMKLIKTHIEGPHSAKVYKDSDWGEYRVKYYKRGVHQPEADSHHDDAKDAHNTAKFQLKKMSEEIEQVDKNLKRFAETNQISDKLLEAVISIIKNGNKS